MEEIKMETEGMNLPESHGAQGIEDLSLASQGKAQEIINLCPSVKKQCVSMNLTWTSTVKQREFSIISGLPLRKEGYTPRASELDCNIQPLSIAASGHPSIHQCNNNIQAST